LAKITLVDNVDIKCYQLSVWRHGYNEEAGFLIQRRGAQLRVNIKIAMLLLITHRHRHTNMQHIHTELFIAELAKITLVDNVDIKCYQFSVW